MPMWGCKPGKNIKMVWPFMISAVFALLAIQPTTVEGLCSPGPYAGFVGALSSLEHGVSGTVAVDSSCKITVRAPTYDGLAPAAYWWCSSSSSDKDMRAGFKANPMRITRALDGTQDVVVDLDPRVDFASNCRVFGMWCAAFNANFGDVTIKQSAGGGPGAVTGPSGLSLKNCKELIPGKLQLMWDEVNKTTVTMALVGARLAENSWMGFGFADPKARASRMIGSDVVVAGVLPGGQPWAVDYFLTTKEQCNYQEGQSEGVCPDAGLSGGKSKANNVAVLSGSRTSGGGLTVVAFRRTLAASDKWDRRWAAGNASAFAVFAHGPLGEASTAKLPIVLYHGADAHSPPRFLFSFGRPSTCSVPLANVSLGDPPKANVTPVATLENVTLINVTTGDNANYPNPPAWGISYHLNEYESPVLRLQRGTAYTFNIMAGPTHPFYITDDVIGGASNPNETIFAGGSFSNGTAMRPYVLRWTPPADAPSLLYYQCHTHQKLGWKIQLADPQSASRGLLNQEPPAAPAAARSAGVNTNPMPVLMMASAILIAGLMVST